MERRMLVRTLGLAAGGMAISGAGLLAVRSKGGGDIPNAQTPSSEATLAVDGATLEVLTGADRTVVLAIRTMDNREIANAEFKSYLRTIEGEVLGGPFSTMYERVSETSPGVYLTTLDLPDPGIFEILTVKGQDWGMATIQVIRPEDSAAPVPGDRVISIPTPTTANPQDYQVICTQEPPCAMHDVSLDAALAAGRPVAVLFATPLYCVSATCSPAVGALDVLRQSRGWGNMAFIHTEIYADAGITLGAPVGPQGWNLPVEPYLFTVNADGTILERLEGPQVPSLVTGMVERLASA